MHPYMLEQLTRQRSAAARKAAQTAYLAELTPDTSVRYRSWRTRPGFGRRIARESGSA